jgi:hypothetical protein
MHLLKSRLYGEESVIKMREDFAHSNLIYPYASVNKDKIDLAL